MVAVSPSKLKNMNAISENSDSDDSEDSNDNRNKNLAKFNKIKQQHDRKISNVNTNNTTTNNGVTRKRSQSNSSNDNDDEEDYNPYRKAGEVRQSDLPRHLRKQQSILFKVYNLSIFDYCVHICELFVVIIIIRFSSRLLLAPQCMHEY
jgi:hypothetical protein